MLFKFLRQYFHDDEFERTKIQLAESKALLTEYKDFIENEKKNQDNEKKKVDPDFLVMIWASIGLALSIGVEAVSHLPKVNNIHIKDFGMPEKVWLIFALYTVGFIVYNGIFALLLTLDYAKTKKNTGYRDFAITLIAGIILLFIGLVIMAQVNAGKTP